MKTEKQKLAVAKLTADPHSIARLADGERKLHDAMRPFKEEIARQNGCHPSEIELVAIIRGKSLKRAAA